MAMMFKPVCAEGPDVLLTQFYIWDSVFGGFGRFDGQLCSFVFPVGLLAVGTGAVFDSVLGLFPPIGLPHPALIGEEVLNFEEVPNLTVT